MGYIELAKHCIGLDRKKPYKRHGTLFYRPYRNFFSTGKEYDDWETLVLACWETLVLAGYAVRGEQNQHGGYTYHLTREGLDWLGKELGMYIWDEEE